MKRGSYMKKFMLTILILCLVSVTFLFAVDPPYDARNAEDALNKSKSLDLQARKEYADGFYEESVETSALAKAYAELSSNWYAANTLYKRAFNKMDQAKKMKYDIADPSGFAEYTTILENAKSAYDAKDFITSMNYSNELISMLDELNLDSNQQVYIVDRNSVV